MPKKGKSKKGKGKKGKGKKKPKERPEPPPLHELTTLYDELIACIEDFRAARNKARKKRIEAWYMTREMMSLNHDKAVYHKYLKEKMDEAERIMNELTKQLNEERDEVEKIIAKRTEEMNRIIAGYKDRSAKALEALEELKAKLMEFEPMMRELAALMAKLRELQALIPIYELEANIKTRHLKNQYLAERARLQNHLENELYILIMTCRSHLMPILSDHMTSMEMENRCNRWDLGNLDLKNFELYREREALLEKRNRLNMEREYLSIDWAFNKLTQIDARNKQKKGVLKMKKNLEGEEDDCELAVAFRAYLSGKLNKIEEEKIKEAKLQARREAKQRKLQRELEKKKRAEALAKKRAKALAAKRKKGKEGAAADTEDEEEDEYYEDEWGELEYYEDEDGNWVIATPSRMLQHKAILENKTLADVEEEVEDIKQLMSSGEDESGSDSGSGSGSYSGSGSEGSLESLSELENDEEEGAVAAPKKGSDGFGDDDGFDDAFIDDDDDIY